MKVEMDSKNDLLKRRDVIISFNHTGNPGFAVAKQKIAEHFKAHDEVIVVRGVKSEFGKNSFAVEASIYHSAADKTAFEPPTKVKKPAAGGQ